MIAHALGLAFLGIFRCAHAKFRLDPWMKEVLDGLVADLAV
ncbi:MAG TPA: hypothetical protein VFS52_11755 [Steroidobacteraceae bacterium]|nr:hypothetical protein [Steroidobacteraceae bacterium]